MPLLPLVVNLPGHLGKYRIHMWNGRVTLEGYYCRLRVRRLTLYSCKSAPDLRRGLSGILSRPPPPFNERIRYGGDPCQFAELRFPGGRGPFPLLFVVHDGFWQSTYDLAHTGHLCAALTSKGTITCNLEYRRLGNSGGGWPATFQDHNQHQHQRNDF